MATTTTVYNILDSKFKRMGFDGIFDKEQNQFITTNSKNFTTYQIASFTDLAFNATTDEFFAGIILDDKEVDRHFKHIFINRFLLREIKFQTLDMFRAKLSSMYVSDSQYIISLYKYYDDFIKGTATGTSTTVATSTGTNTNNQTGTRDGRTATRQLPQDLPDLDLNNDMIDYPDSTDAQKEKTTQDSNAKSVNNSESKTDTLSQQISIDNFDKLTNLYDDLLRKYERSLFLNIW